MSAIYRFGFEHGNVPQGITINSGSYYWIGREGNCSLYGEYPNVSCELGETTKIRGSFYALSYDHNINNMAHDGNKSFVEFGNVKLKCNGSGNYAINVGGVDTVELTGIDVYRGEWIPIRYSIDLGNPSYIELEVKYTKITDTTATTETPQTSVIVGGFGHTGLLEDIAINSSGGSLDTGIPNLINAVPAFYTGYSNTGWSEGGSSDSFTYGGVTDIYNIENSIYSPLTNKYYLQAASNSSIQNPKFVFNVENKEYENLYLGINGSNSVYTNRIVTCPSRGTIFVATGIFSSPSASETTYFDWIEIDANNNIVNNLSKKSIEHTTIIASSYSSDILQLNSFYHARTNKIYYHKLLYNLNISQINYIDCETLETGFISLSFAIRDTDSSLSHFMGHEFLDNIYYVDYNNKLSSFNLLNNSNVESSVPSVSDTNYTDFSFLMPNIGSGILNNAPTLTRFTIFNLNNIENNFTGIFLAGDNNRSSISYSLLNKTLINLQGNGTYVKMTFPNTGDLKYFSGPVTSLATNNTKYNYCSYDNSIYFANTTTIPLVKFCFNKNIYTNYPFDNIQYNDNSYLSTDTIGSESNFKLSTYTGNSFEGVNIYYQLRKDMVDNPLIDIGINTGINQSLSGIILQDGQWQNMRNSFLYNNDGSKITFDQSNQIKPYIKYSGNI